MTLYTPKESFSNVITKRSDGIEHCCEINWPTLIALTAIWLLVGLTLVKGYVYLGKIAYTWSAALIQVCFTLNIGYGGIIVIASYNAKNNNCYKVR
ncbi:hypothetical protein ANCCEY_11674 [Ancylostoma ceylanicum]|uniref:Uncharacterized protein n=1 Tax=Ancylostoma ceylanicum TaxID=53326 RepID=A0A0D6LBH5_9BILA|nr:hypothetical protein ANCCEY_11674 [Ancylostoma ceylanicum]